MYDLFNSLLIAFALVSCNQKALVIDNNDYKIEILNFDDQNFIYSQPPFGSELDRYKSEIDSVIILIDDAPPPYGLSTYYNEESFIDAFDNLKYQEINFLITLNTKLTKDS